MICSTIILLEVPDFGTYAVSLEAEVKVWETYVDGVYDDHVYVDKSTIEVTGQEEFEIEELTAIDEEVLGNTGSFIQSLSEAKWLPV